MGALEYRPARKNQTNVKNKDIELESLMKLAQEVLDARKGFRQRTHFDDAADTQLPRVERNEIDAIIDDVINAVSQWPQLAKAHDVPKTLADSIEGHLRLKDFA